MAWWARHLVVLQAYLFAELQSPRFDNSDEILSVLPGYSSTRATSLNTFARLSEMPVSTPQRFTRSKPAVLARVPPHQQKPATRRLCPLLHLPLASRCNSATSFFSVCGRGGGDGAQFLADDGQ